MKGEWVAVVCTCIYYVVEGSRATVEKVHTLPHSGPHWAPGPQGGRTPHTLKNFYTNIGFYL